jgi:cell division protein FtsB
MAPRKPVVGSEDTPTELAPMPRVLTAPEPIPEKKEDSIPVQIIPAGDIISSFRQFSDTIDTSFWDNDTSLSTILDIISVYLNGQKVLYIEAKTHCERRLFALMLPTILIAGACTVLGIFIQDKDMSNKAISGMTAVSTVLLSIINYLKLDGKAEAHKIAAYQFDKLQTMCEFNSGKVMFKYEKNVGQIITDIQKKVEEIKENNQWIIPEAVRFRFPLIYSKNVFRDLKRLENSENTLKAQLSSLYSELETLQALEQNDSTKAEIKTLEAKKLIMLTEYINMRNQYNKLDSDITQELREQARRNRLYCSPCGWFLT